MPPEADFIRSLILWKTVLPVMFPKNSSNFSNRSIIVKAPNNEPVVLFKFVSSSMASGICSGVKSTNPETAEKGPVVVELIPLTLK